MSKSATLEHTVNTTPEKAQKYFSDFSKFSALHPLFVGMEQVDAQNFIIRERMPVSGIIFKYKANVSVNGNEVLYIAKPFFYTLILSFVFSPGKMENTCLIKETIEVKGPMPGILSGLVKKMHPRLIAKLNSQL